MGKDPQKIYHSAGFDKESELYRRMSADAQRLHLSNNMGLFIVGQLARYYDLLDSLAAQQQPTVTAAPSGPAVPPRLPSPSLPVEETGPLEYVEDASTNAAAALQSSWYTPLDDEDEE